MINLKFVRYLAENKEFLEFALEMKKVIKEKTPKHKDSWKTCDFLILKKELYNRINTLGLTSDKTPRKLLHIAIYSYFCYTRLKQEGL